MISRSAHHSPNGSGPGTASALDALLVAESEAERALKVADDEARQLLSRARERALEIEREGAQALRRDLEQREFENAACLERQSKEVADAAQRRVTHLRELSEETIQDLATLVVARLTELPL